MTSRPIPFISSLMPKNWNLCADMRQLQSSNIDRRGEDGEGTSSVPVLHIQCHRHTRRVAPGAVAPRIILLTTAKTGVYNTSIHVPLLWLVVHPAHAHASYA